MIVFLPFSYHTPYFYFEAESVTEPEANRYPLTAWPTSFRDLSSSMPLLSSARVKRCAALPDFYPSARDPNAGLHACLASTLPMSRFSSPSANFLMDSSETGRRN